MLSPNQAPAPLPSEDVHTSAVLGAIIDEAPLKGFTLEWLINNLPHRSFGAIMLLLAIVAMVPVVSIAAGLLIAILAVQIVMGYKTPVFPQRLMKRPLPTRYLLLDRSIATLGAVGIELYPDFNVFEVARPYARSLMLERFAPERMARRARRDVVRYAQIAREAPYQFHDFMEQIRDGQLEVGFVHKGLDDFLEHMQRIANRLVIALIVTGGLMGSSLIGIFAKGGPHILGVNVISIVGFALSAVLGVWLLASVIRSGRL